MIARGVGQPDTTQLLSRLLRRFPLRAGAFIVTLYGDVVAPRGGSLWIGNIIETCALAAISESRVRTAVSRLMAAEQIVGARAGRRSFYRLTPTAVTHFQAAARRIYRCPESDVVAGWHLVVLPHGPEREQVARRLTELRFGFVTNGMAILPDRGVPMEGVGGTHFRQAQGDDVAALVHGAWPLETLNDKATDFIAGFAPFEGLALDGEAALVLRLMLVHIYRELALADPDLPPDLMPESWRGAEARALFARLYLELAGPADDVIAQRFIAEEGPLKADTGRLRRRLNDLAG